MPHYWSTSKKSIKLEQWSPMDEAEFIKLQKDYYAAITGLDDQFARIYAYLKEHNLFDDTIVVLTADHGEMYKPWSDRKTCMVRRIHRHSLSHKRRGP